MCGRPRDVAVGGLRLRAWEWGAPGRPPVLLLHSLAAHSHWWDWVGPLASARFHVVALDFRGHGASDWAPGGRYAFDDWVADVVGALAALGWPAAGVVGHSLGGYVGALLAARHPARVRALVISDILTGWSDALDRFVRAQAARPASTFASAAEAAERFRLSPPETTAPADRLRHLGEAGVVERRPGVWEHAFDRRVFLHPPPDPWPFLGEVACPTLVVRGERSAIMSAEACARVAAAVRWGTPAEIAAARHHLVVEAPEAYTALVGDWLAAAA